MASIRLAGVTVRRGRHHLLDRVELDVGSGERLVVLGPSGSGKTTLLRVIAGVEDPDEGAVLLGGRDVTRMAPRDRDVAMVDQLASLQPHLDVRGNIGFPLELRHLGRREIDERVRAEARALSIVGLLRRRPETLSEGERSDVALARSLVRRGRVLLLDEPFARADPTRREVLLRELIQVQEGYGVTLVAATNDQRVAMGLAQRLAVLDAGRLVQVGTPTQLYGAPATLFVAGFVGSPAMNLLPAEVRRETGGITVVAGPLRIPTRNRAVAAAAGQEAQLGVRPPDLVPTTTDDPVVFEGVVARHAFLGPRVEVELDVGGRPVVAVLAPPAPRPGVRLRLRADPGALHLFAADGRALTHGL